MKAPLRLGLALGGPTGRDAVRAGWARLLERAAFAEELGFHSVWVPEGHFRRGAMASPLVALSAVAARTRRIGLGTTSLLLPIHHPLRVAEEVAALDALSDGRVLLGLGRGFAAPIFQAFRVQSATKRDRFDEALDAIRAAWSGAPLTLDGVHFATRGEHAAALRPVQRPHPPLLVAAFGRKGLLQAARHGLPYLASPLEPLDLLAENYAFHRESLAPGVSLAPFAAPVMRTLHVAADAAEARAVLDRLDAEAAATAGALPPALVRAAAGPASARAIVGEASAVADALARYRERLGLDLLVVRSEVSGLDEPAQRRSLEALATRVLPALG
ncbi:MAG TPA: LLM class flavin-dependent oxidoreductase [Myxococcota bacterium]|jgi:alkanesulfonate monooxygenase SsuD/methylene tetrahydromethanopterin reductase-like flavin-dependent oxidoreductase (luciferase family)|nr:LLM class flavin-dependent oxidoreductase [Myxococcota bacterium]